MVNGFIQSGGIVMSKWMYHDETPIEHYLRFYKIFVDRNKTMKQVLFDPGLWVYDNWLEERYGFRLYTERNWWKRTRKTVIMTKHHPLWKEKDDDSIIH